MSFPRSNLTVPLLSIAAFIVGLAACLSFFPYLIWAEKNSLAEAVEIAKICGISADYVHLDQEIRGAKLGQVNLGGLHYLDCTTGKEDRKFSCFENAMKARSKPYRMAGLNGTCFQLTPAPMNNSINYPPL